MAILLEGLHQAKDDKQMLAEGSTDKNFGIGQYNGFYEHFPMFFTRFGSEINIVGQYHGASIFLICNGPSLASGKYDLSLLKRPGVMTYGMNNGARTVRPNLWSCVDDPTRFIKSIWLDPVITKIVPFSFAEKPLFDNEQWKENGIKVQDCPNIIYYRRNEKFVANRFLKEMTINWGNHKDHGGGRSVMLAILKIMFLLGFRNVFLMGADFKMSSNYTYHFDEQRDKGAVNGNTDTYDKLMNYYFPSLKPYFDAEGFHIYNCNPESELKVFDYVPYEEAISFATTNLGDVDNERTWGMYSKRDEKQKWVNEPNEASKSHLGNIPLKSAPIFTDESKPVVAKTPITRAIPRPAPIAPSIPRQIITKPTTVQEVKINIDDRIDTCAAPCLLKSSPMQSVPTRPVMPEVKRVNMKPLPQPTQPTQPTQQNINNNSRIIRSMPCGGGISFGSSHIDNGNITIPDDGK